MHTPIIIFDWMNDLSKEKLTEQEKITYATIYTLTIGGTINARQSIKSICSHTKLNKEDQNSTIDKLIKKNLIIKDAIDNSEYSIYQLNLSLIPVDVKIESLEILRETLIKNGLIEQKAILKTKKKCSSSTNIDLLNKSYWTIEDTSKYFKIHVIDVKDIFKQHNIKPFYKTKNQYEIAEVLLIFNTNMENELSIHTKMN